MKLFNSFAYANVSLIQYLLLDSNAVLIQLFYLRFILLKVIVVAVNQIVQFRVPGVSLYSVKSRTSGLLLGFGSLLITVGLRPRTVHIIRIIIIIFLSFWIVFKIAQFFQVFDLFLFLWNFKLHQLSVGLAKEVFLKNLIIAFVGDFKRSLFPQTIRLTGPLRKEVLALLQAYVLPFIIVHNSAAFPLFIGFQTHFILNGFKQFICLPFKIVRIHTYSVLFNARSLLLLDHQILSKLLLLPSFLTFGNCLLANQIHLL